MAGQLYGRPYGNGYRKAQDKNPADYATGTGNNPFVSADIASQAALRAAIAYNPVPAGYARGRPTNAAVPTKTVPFKAVMSALSEPFLLLPSNPRRVGLTLTNQTYQMCFWSYNLPVFDNGNPVGNCLLPMTTIESSQGFVSTEEVYCFLLDTGIAPSVMLAFEHIPAVQQNG